MAMRHCLDNISEASRSRSTQLDWLRLWTPPNFSTVINWLHPSRSVNNIVLSIYLISHVISAATVTAAAMVQTQTPPSATNRPGTNGQAIRTYRPAYPAAGRADAHSLSLLSGVGTLLGRSRGRPVMGGAGAHRPQGGDD